MTELHGGSVEIESTPNVGTTVSVAFPPHRTLR
jgi:signal transduction histidine kinase